MGGGRRAGVGEIGRLAVEAETVAARVLRLPRGWADHGIITIPAAVVHPWEGAHPLRRWGGNYQHSKDMMHLEVPARSAVLGANRR